MNELSGALTRTASYPGSICSVDDKAKDYLLRKINDEIDPLAEQAGRLENQLIDLASQMIARLHPRDFELLVDLLFARCRWQRISAVGDGEMDIDLLLTQLMIAELQGAGQVCCGPDRSR